MTVERSIVYVLDSYTFDIHERGVLAAQRYALEAELPLAVAAIVPGSDIAHPPLRELKDIEEQLQNSNIPLLTLIGDRLQALRGISYHLAPRIVPQDTAESKEVLRPHPYPWPNQVLSTHNLFKYASEHPEMCIF
jgi:hypothetical protein